MRHCHNEGPKLATSVFVEVYLVMERLLSVDLVLAARTVVVVGEFVLCVLDACASAVALVVESVSIRSIA